MNPLSLSARLVVVGVFFITARSGFADQVWKGTTDNQWTNTSNWSGGAVPGSGDNVVYNGSSTANLNNSLSQGFSIAGILFTNPAGPVSITSTSTLTNGAGGINMSNATQGLTINAPVALGANQSWNVATNQTLTVSGAVSGGTGLYKDGFGTLALSGTNTFSGNFTNNGGAVWINNSAGLGTGSKTIYIVNNLVGAGLHLNGTNGNITLASSLGFVISQQYGAILNEAGDNAINGPMSVFSGGGYAYIVANTGSLTLNGGITLGATARSFALGGAANGTNNGTINNSTGLSLRKLDAGSWTITANNTYNGYTTVEAGTLVLGPNAKIGGTTNITVFANATLDVSVVTNVAGSNALFLTAGQVLAGGGLVKGSVNAGAAGNIIQPGSLNIAQTAGGMGAAGTLTVSSNLTLGATTTNYFELNPFTTPGGGTNDLVSVGGNLDPQGAYISIGTLNGLVNGTYRLFNYAGSKLSSFNATVLNPASIRGSFTIDESVAGQINLVVSGIVNLVWSGTGSSSTWDLNSTADWNANAVKFLTGDSVIFDDTGTAPTINLSGTVQPGSVTFSNAAVSYTLASTGKITGLAGLTKSGSGTLTITAGASDFTGPVTINGGILSITNFTPSGVASAIGAGSNIVLNGGTFQFSGGTRPVAGAVNRAWTLGPNGGTVQSTAVTFFMSNQISGVGSLTKSGSQQLILGDLTAGLLTAGNNAYTGNTYITQGELQIRNANALGYGKAVVASGADLAVGGSTNYGTVTNDIDLYGYDTGGFGAISIGDASTGISFGGTITLLGNSSIGCKANASAVTLNIPGPIVGSGSLTKLQISGGALTCNLAGSNTYSGNTIVSGGTLQVGGSINNSPNISVASGAKLTLVTGGSLGNSVNISLAAGGFFGLGGLGNGTTYTLGSSATLNASGTGTTSGSNQAEIKGATSGFVNLGSQPISLTFTPTGFTGDTTHPPLVISLGTLQLSGNIITVNNNAGTALGAGTYRLIQVTSATTSGSPNATPFITGKGLAAGDTGVISVSSGNVILTVTATSPTATTTTLSSLTGSAYGSSVTFTATVAPTPTGGTVQFYDNGVAIGSPATVSSGTATYTTSALWAGTHPMTAAYSGTSGYAASATASASSQTVSAVALSITANADSKTYGQTKTYGAGSTAFTSSGLQNGDTITSVFITASGGTAATDGTNTYSLMPSAAVGGAFNATNYTITYNAGTLTVNPLAANLTGTRAYDGTTNAVAANLSVANIANGDNLTVASGTGGLAGANVGSRSITSVGTLALGGTRATNYTVAGASGSVTILQTNLTVTAQSNTKIYNGTASATNVPVITAGSLQAGDSATLTEVYATTNIGTGLTLIPSVAITNAGVDVTANYNVAKVNNTTGVINPASLTLNLISSSQTNGYLDSVSFTVTNLPVDAGSNVVFSANGTPFSTNDVVNGGTTSLAINNLPRSDTNNIIATYNGDGTYPSAYTNLIQTVTNHPPVVTGDLTVTRNAGQAYHISITNILAQVTDQDGDPISLTGYSVTFTNGLTLSSNANYLTYSNAANVGDRFSYTVSDGYDSATGYVNVNILNGFQTGSPITGQQSTNSPTGAFTVTYNGVIGYTYVVQRSTDLTTWLNIATNTIGDSGFTNVVDDFSDLGYVPPSSAYYRVAWKQ